jgi:hypothetical protein
MLLLCVHDWTLACLNRDLDNELYQKAFHCVARSVKWETEAEYWVVNRRLLQHMHRLNTIEEDSQSIGAASRHWIYAMSRIYVAS